MLSTGETVPADLVGDMVVVVTGGATRRAAGLGRSARDDVLAGRRSSRTDWQQVLDINVVSAAMLARAVRPHLVNQGAGAIVNVTSLSSKVAQTGRWLYPVSKAAMVQLTRNMAMVFAADRIRVNSVSRGWTWSRVGRAQPGERAKTDKIGADYHLLGHVGNAEEVGQVVASCSLTT